MISMEGTWLITLYAWNSMEFGFTLILIIMSGVLEVSLGRKRSHPCVLQDIT